MPRTTHLNRPYKGLIFHQFAVCPARRYVTAIAIGMCLFASACRDAVIDIPVVRVINDADDHAGIEPYVLGMRWQTSFRGSNFPTQVELLEPGGDQENRDAQEAPYIPPKLGNNLPTGDYAMVPEYVGRAHYSDVGNPIAAVPAYGDEVPLEMYGMIMCALEVDDNQSERMLHLEGFRRMATFVDDALSANVAATSLRAGQQSAFNAMRSTIDAIVAAEREYIRDPINQLDQQQEELLDDFVDTVEEELPNAIDAAIRQDTGAAVQGVGKLIYKFVKYLLNRTNHDDLLGCVHLTRVNASEAVWTALKGDLSSNEYRVGDTGPYNCSSRRHPVCPHGQPFGGGTGGVSFGETSLTTYLEATPLELSYDGGRDSSSTTIQYYNVAGSQQFSALPYRTDGNSVVIASIPDFRSHGNSGQDFSFEIDVEQAEREYDITATGNSWDPSATIELATVELPGYVQVRRDTIRCYSVNCTELLFNGYAVPAGYTGKVITEVLELDAPATGYPFDVRTRAVGSRYEATVEPGWGRTNGRYMKVRFTLLTWPQDRNVYTRQWQIHLDGAQDGTIDGVPLTDSDAVFVTPVHGENTAGYVHTGYTSRRTINGSDEEYVAAIEHGGGKFELQVIELDFP